MFKNPWRPLFLVIGIALFGLILWRIDLGAALDHAVGLGWGIVAIFAVYQLAFVADTWSWQLILGNSRQGSRWFYHLWKVRMVGAAASRIMPFVGMAGEPIKAVLLNRHYGFGYSEAVSSLIAAKTINLLALVAFLIAGLVAATGAVWLPAEFRMTAWIGFAVLATGAAVVFLLQVGRATSRIGSAIRNRLQRSWTGQSLQAIVGVENRLIDIYRLGPRRLSGSILATFANWLLGAAELWLILYFLDNPISIVDALVIDAGVELVRAATFFIPASIGAQEGAIVLLMSALTGQAPLGLAVALIRRLREAIWVLWGGAIAWLGFERSLIALPTLPVAPDVPTNSDQTSPPTGK
ncbi:MAG: lysylphosphatidylglycerol synthase transmembrane domain-containing protein [Rhodospirillales bacterium]